MVTFNASTNKHWLWWHYSSLLMPNFVFCLLKTQCSKDNVKKKKKIKKKIKKTKQNRTNKRKINALSAHFSFINNTIEITLPSPDDAIDTQVFLIVRRSTPMLGAFCSITGGQRDFIWFPKFRKKKTKNNPKTKQKQTNLLLIPLNFLMGSLTCRIQRNFTWIELIFKTNASFAQMEGDRLPFALIAAHSHFEAKVLARDNRKDKNPSLRFSLGNNERHYWSETRTESKPQKTKHPGGPGGGAPTTIFLLSVGLSRFFPI